MHASTSPRTGIRVSAVGQSYSMVTVVDTYTKTFLLMDFFFASVCQHVRMRVSLSIYLQPDEARNLPLRINRRSIPCHTCVYLWMCLLGCLCMYVRVGHRAGESQCKFFQEETRLSSTHTRQTRAPETRPFLSSFLGLIRVLLSFQAVGSTLRKRWRRLFLGFPFLFFSWRSIHRGCLSILCRF